MEPKDLSRDEQKRLVSVVRDLEQNTSIVPSALEALVSSFVGSGIVPNPLVRKNSGDPDEKLNDKLSTLWKLWTQGSELSNLYDEYEAQAMAVRALYRDGEVIHMHHMGLEAKGEVAGIPYTYTLMECDTLEETDEYPQGIKMDEFGRPESYSFITENARTLKPKTKKIDASKISHVALRTRIMQRRGISIFAPICDEISAIDEIDEAELIAAKISSMLAIMIVRGEYADFTAPITDDDDEDDSNQYEINPGSIIDNLDPGEKLEVVESKRPSYERANFRKVMLKSIAGGIGPVSYSRMARDYDGTYSSQRQELSEIRDLQLPHWSRLVRYEKVKWRNFVEAAKLAGLVSIPKNVDVVSLYNPEYTAIVTPWIDPAKEIMAYKGMVELKLESRKHIAAMRGRDERVIRNELKEESEVDVYSGSQPNEEEEQESSQQGNDPKRVQIGSGRN